jgi:hypothetical protein
VTFHPRFGDGQLANLALTAMPHRDNTLHFLHIGKTGGTAIKHALQAIADVGNLRLHGHGTRLTDIPPGEQVAFALRTPAARFVSAFHSRQRKGRPRYDMPWTPDEATAFGRFETPNELANGLSSSSAAERKRAERAMRAIAHVNSRYWDWLVGEEYLFARAADIRFIALQEALASDFATLRAALGLPDDAELPDDDLAAHRNPATLDRSLDEGALRNLAIWYRDDYAALRACRRLARERQLGGAICAADWIDADAEEAARLAAQAGKP